MKKLSIIIPVYNEEKTVGKLLRRVAGVNFGKWGREIIVVDDGSKDRSKVKIQNAKLQFKIQNLIILSHRQNMGKGAAIQTGLKHITGDVVIVQDADLEYNPADLPKLLRKMEEDKADIVMGSRNLNLKEQILHVWGINFSTFLINLLYGSNISDLYTCYKLYKTEALKSVRAESYGFEWDIEMMVKLLKKGYKVSEAPVRYVPRGFAQGKKIKPWDGIVGIWVIIKNRF